VTPEGERSVARGRSVRSHLVAVVAVVVVVFVLAGALAARYALRHAETDSRASARYLAGVAADAVDATIGAGVGQVTGVAANPSLPALIASRQDCHLSFGLELFPGSHLDVVSREGDIVCSSHPRAEDASHAGQDWLDQDADRNGVFESRPFHDGLTDGIAVALGAPITDAAGTRLGSVVLVLPTRPAGARLAETFGGPRRFRFAIVDAVDGRQLAGTSRAGPDVIAASTSTEIVAWQMTATISEQDALAPAWADIRRGALMGMAVLLALITSLAVLHRSIAGPLKRLSAAVTATGSTTQEALAAVGGPRETRHLAATFQAAAAARDEYESRLARQALHDPLTGLPNRVLLGERLKHSLEQVARSAGGVAVLFLDVDRFKLVNDGLGHAVGDEVLVSIATRLGGAIRPGDTLARVGGDEFVVVGEGIQDAEQAALLAARFSDVLAPPIEVAGTTVQIGVSVGIALSTGLEHAPADLVRDADTAMYQAKADGGGGHRLFDQDLGRRATNRVLLERDLRAAVEAEELDVVYQVKIDLVSGHATGAEALLRWTHHEKGPISPVEFIPIAEETGLIAPIGRFVLQRAGEQAMSWRAHGVDLPVSVNLSGRQLAERNLVEDVASMLRTTGLPADGLCLELTESILMVDTTHTIETLGRIHDLGVRLSIDDFGTGYSSLGYLYRFPVDELKIDRTFVNDIVEHPDVGTLVAAMVAMGKTLGLDVVAEGVETAEQAARLRFLGCDGAQGYLFGRPEPGGQITARLAQPASR
jgi:diguanylate cyclase (GGDEF)-like protein